MDNDRRPALLCRVDSAAAEQAVGAQDSAAAGPHLAAERDAGYRGDR